MIERVGSTEPTLERNDRQKTIFHDIYLLFQSS